MHKLCLSLPQQDRDVEQDREDAISYASRNRSRSRTSRYMAKTKQVIKVVFVLVLNGLSPAKKKDKYRRSLLMVGRLTWMPHCNHLAEWMIWTKSSILVGWWFGIVCTRCTSIYSMHPFRQVAFILFILVFKIIPVENSQRDNELNQFRPPNSSNDLCLLFCRYPSSIEIILKRLDRYCTLH